MKYPGEKHKSTYLCVISGRGEYEGNVAARNSSSNFKKWAVIIPEQTGLSNRKLASKVKHQLQVDEIHSYLKIYRTHFYILESVKHRGSPMIFNPDCTLKSLGSLPPSPDKNQSSSDSGLIGPRMRMGQALILFKVP